MPQQFPLEKFQNLKTPFYFYDMNLLERTLQEVKCNSDKYGFVVHYAIKANANIRLLEMIKRFGFGVDCVSGYEIKRALEVGFSPEGIVYAGVGKADCEIELGIDSHISCCNVEELTELEVSNEIAAAKKKVVSLAIRITPNVTGNTAHYITTGLDDNKFGVSQADLESVMDAVVNFKHIQLE